MRSIEFKIVVSIVLFTILIVALERIQLSKSVKEQFIKSQKSKHELLINTISPIVSLNLSLGLGGSSADYLEQIARQNRDIKLIRLSDLNDNVIYEYVTDSSYKLDKGDANYCMRRLEDDFTQKKLAKIELHFSDREFKEMQLRNREIGINIIVITVVLLVLFVLFVKYEFRALKKLTTAVLLYDPKENNFPLKEAKGEDEVSLIQNAIISMVNKINLYTQLLDSHKTLLEKKVKQRTVELEQSNRELKLLASVDPLTNLYNRRYFLKTSEQISEIARREKTKISILMLDIDKFKVVNDTYGHKVGDEVILFVASVLKEMTRKSDIVCRFGGEEFLILFPQTDVKGAYTIAEKIRMHLEKSPLKIEDGTLVNVTVSIGVTECYTQEDRSIEDVIHRADHLMYAAKESGRNRTCIAKPQQT